MLNNFALPGSFPYILCYPTIYPFVILVCLLLTCVALFQSKDNSTQWMPYQFCVSFWSFYLQLIVACKLNVIYVREYDDFNVEVLITRLILITCTAASAVREGSVNSITHSLTNNWNIVIFLTGHTRSCHISSDATCHKISLTSTIFSFYCMCWAGFVFYVLN